MWKILKNRRILLVIGLCFIMASSLLTYVGAERYFLEKLAVQGTSEATLYREIIRGWLGRFQALPSIYAAHPEIKQILSQEVISERHRFFYQTEKAPLLGGAEKSFIEQKMRVNELLASWSISSGASDIYLLDRLGTTIAASNWNLEASFIGKDFSFRPYFSQAMQGRLGRFFALGIQSKKRGYYFAFPVRDGRKISGVLVVKLAVDGIEQELRAREHEIFISDAAGVILIASHPEWRMTALNELRFDQLQRIDHERQFDAINIELTSIENAAIVADLKYGNVVQAVPDRSDKEMEKFLQLTQPMIAEGWNLHILMPLQQAQWSAIFVAILVSSLLFALIMTGTAIIQRRARFIQLLEIRSRAQQDLEQKVKERTRDLQKSKEELEHTQSELVQAGKLAALGQMSTALSHEFNQPLTAIRTYADNAKAFLERDMYGQVQDNLQRIMNLTERMGKLSKRLSTFARKPNETVSAVNLQDAMDEALELLQARIERSNVEIQLDIPPGLQFWGGQIRLQHVLMNLIINAMDAMAEQDEKKIVIQVTTRKNELEIKVSDTGPGVDSNVIEKVFDPFFTTKEVGKGLGLGLSISYNIIRDFGGHMYVFNRKNEAGDILGACFVVRLRQVSGQKEN